MSQPAKPYEHQAYPKFKYHATEPAQIVESPEHEEALGEGWEETPAAFEPEKPARKPKAK